MMGGINEIAKMLKDRENPVKMGLQTGEVISTAPLKIRLGNEIVLGTGNVVFAAHLLSGYSRTVMLDSGAPLTAEATDGLVAGDKVIVAADEKEQTFFVLDKAVRL